MNWTAEPTAWIPNGLAGTKANYGGGGFYSLEEHLIDDGQWQTYEITTTNPFSSFHVMVEDWISAGGVSGDVFFDNITVVPEPSTFLLATLGGLSIVIASWRRRREGEQAHIH